MFGIEPDLITVAKGLTSAYIPLSGCIVSERVWGVLADATSGVFGHGYTYTAHPVAAAAALENLDIIERDALVERADRVASGCRLCCTRRSTIIRSSVRFVARGCSAPSSSWRRATR